MKKYSPIIQMIILFILFKWLFSSLETEALHEVINLLYYKHKAKMFSQIKRKIIWIIEEFESS